MDSIPVRHQYFSFTLGHLRIIQGCEQAISPAGSFAENTGSQQISTMAAHFADKEEHYCIDNFSRKCTNIEILLSNYLFSKGET